MFGNNPLGALQSGASGHNGFAPQGQQNGFMNGMMNPMTMMGLSLMANSGPSLTPRSGFEGLPQTMAMLQNNQMRQAEYDRRAGMLAEAKAEKEEKKAALNKTAQYYAKMYGDDPGIVSEIFNAGQGQSYLSNKKSVRTKPFAVSGVGVYDPNSGEYIMPPRLETEAGLSPAGEKKYNETKGKNIANAEAAKEANLQGAIGFLTKAGRSQELLEDMTDADFGPVQGSDVYRYVPGTSFVMGTDMGAQDRYKGAQSELELDVAKMKLKGQGQVTEAERKIARDTLGGLTVADKKTASDILKNTSKEAKLIIAEALRHGDIAPEDLERQGINVRQLLADLETDVRTRLSQGDEDDVDSLIEQYGG